MLALVGLLSLLTSVPALGQPRPGMPPGGMGPGGVPGQPAGQGGAQNDSTQEAVESIMDCVMFSRRDRYYPFRGSMTVTTRDEETGKWRSAPDRILDPVARWNEDDMTFILMAEATRADGGIDLANRPHAVVSVPNSAFQAIDASSTEKFNVSLLYRWGPETTHEQVGVELTRAASFNYRYKLARPLTAFDTRPGNPRASKVAFQVFFTWDCEQDFRQAMSMGITRDELMKKVGDEMSKWRKYLEGTGPAPNSMSAMMPGASGAPGGPGGAPGAPPAGRP